MKKFTSVLILAFAVIFGAHSAVATSLDNRDLAFAFGSEGIATEMQMLSEQEMVETEGAFFGLIVRFGKAIWNFIRPAVVAAPKNAGYGAVTGSASYLGGSLVNDNWTLRGQLAAAGGGAVGGALSPNKWTGVGGAVAGGAMGAYLNSPPSQNNSRNFGRDIGFYCGMCRNFSR